MKRLTTLAAIITTILLSSTAMTADIQADDIYQAGSQYTAVLNTGNSQWQVLPSDGQDFAIQVQDNCHSNAKVPHGLWLLTRDANGKPELLAPSQTVLPAGHSGHIAIVGCDENQADGIAVPASVIQYLSDNTGAVYVE